MKQTRHATRMTVAAPKSAARRAGGPPSRRRASGARGPIPIREAVEHVLSACEVTVRAPMSGLLLSPEQLRFARHTGERTDVWGLGVMLYRLLTGRDPFEGDSAFAVFMGIAADDPPSPRFLRPEIPVALEDIVMRCLEKDAHRRVQTVAELAAAIAPFRSPFPHGRVPPPRGGSVARRRIVDEE